MYWNIDTLINNSQLEKNNTVDDKKHLILHSDWFKYFFNMLSICKHLPSSEEISTHFRTVFNWWTLGFYDFFLFLFQTSNMTAEMWLMPAAASLLSMHLNKDCQIWIFPIILRYSTLPAIGVFRSVSTWQIFFNYTSSIIYLFCTLL